MAENSSDSSLPTDSGLGYIPKAGPIVNDPTVFLRYEDPDQPRIRTVRVGGALQQTLAGIKTAARELLGIAIEDGLSLETTELDPDYELHTDEDWQAYRECSNGKTQVTITIQNAGRFNLQQRIETMESTGRKRTLSPNSERSSEDDLQDITVFHQSHLEQKEASIPDVAETMTKEFAIVGRNLTPAFSCKMSKLAMPSLEDKLSACNINFGSWKAKTSCKDINDLLTELKTGYSGLYYDEQGKLVRVVRNTVAMVTHSKSDLLLVNILDLENGESQERDVFRVPTYKVGRKENPFDLAINSLQSEVGFSIWGGVQGLRGNLRSRIDAIKSSRENTNENNSMNQATQSRSRQFGGRTMMRRGIQARNAPVRMPHILDILTPGGFATPKIEEWRSDHYSDLKTLHYVDTIYFSLVHDNVPQNGSFTTTDSVKPSTTHVWQWMQQSDVETLRQKLVHSSYCPSFSQLGAALVLPQFRDDRKVSAGITDRSASFNLDPPVSFFGRVKRFLSHDESASRLAPQKMGIRQQSMSIITLPNKRSQLTESVLENWLGQYDINVTKWGQGQSKFLRDLLLEIRKGETNLIVIDIPVRNYEQQTGKWMKSRQKKNSAKPLTTATDPMETDSSKTLRRRRAADLGRGASFRRMTIPGKQILRQTNVIVVSILHSRNRHLELLQTHQILSNGRIRVRLRNVTIKIIPGELPVQALFRGIYTKVIGVHDHEENAHADFIKALSRIHIVSIKPPFSTEGHSMSYPDVTTRYFIHQYICIVDGLSDTEFHVRDHDLEDPKTHYFQWARSSDIPQLRSSLYQRVTFFDKLVSEYKLENDVETYSAWLLLAARRNEVDVIKVLCGSSRLKNRKKSSKQRLIETSSTCSDSSGEDSSVDDGEDALQALEEGAVLDPSTIVDVNQCTPLRLAALSGSKESVVELIRVMIRNTQLRMENELKGEIGAEENRQLSGRLSVPNASSNVNSQQQEGLDEDKSKKLHTIDWEDAFGCSMLYYAAVSNRVSLVESLLAVHHLSIVSVCLHSCIEYGAVDVLAVLLPRLRFDSGSKTRRFLFGVEKNPLHRLELERDGKEPMFEAPKADDFPYFYSLLRFAESKLLELLKTQRAIYMNVDQEVELVPELRSLEIVLENCNPMAGFYQNFLRVYLQNVVLLDDFESEQAVFANFLFKSRFPLHIAILCAATTMSMSSEKRYSNAFLRHSLEFQNFVTNILDECVDQKEAEQLLRERADLPPWFLANGVVATSSQPHKSTCSYLSVKYELKSIVSHRYFTTQNDDIWFRTAGDKRATGKLDSFPLRKTLYQVPWNIGRQTSRLKSIRNDTSKSKGVFSAFKRLFGFSVDQLPYFDKILETAYRLFVTLLLTLILTAFSPIIGMVPFSRRLRLLVDIPATAVSTCYFKWSVWSLSYLVQIVAFILLANDSINAASNGGSRIQGQLIASEIFVLLFLVGNVIGAVERILSSGLAGFLRYSENVIDACGSCCTLVAYLSRLIENRQTEIFDVFMALSALLLTFRIYDLFRASKSLGPLWFTILYVIEDIASFLVLFGAVVVGFMIGMAFLLSGGDVEGFGSLSEAFISLLWSLFDAFSTYGPTQSYRTGLYQLFIFVFLLIVSLVLPNLLIAILTRKAEAVQDEAEREWLFSLAELIDKYGQMPIYPPPLNILVGIPNIAFRLIYGRKRSLYDPWFITNQAAENATNSESKSRKQKVVAVSPEDLSESQSEKGRTKTPVESSKVKEDEMQTLGFRSTRRAVIQRRQDRLWRQEIQQTAMQEHLTAMEERLHHLIEVLEKEPQ